jgi:predicted ArsR family transcriptional regulator
MTDITEQDLLNAIGEWLPKPREPGELTIHEIATAKHVTPYRAGKTMQTMIAAGVASVRDVIGANGKPMQLYKLVDRH